MKVLIATALLALVAAPAAAQNITAPPPPVPDGITVEEIEVHGPSLEGNLEGNDPNRAVMVVLPPSYRSNPTKRYPVIYYLHGFAIDGKNFYNYMRVPEAVAKNASAGNEFIVVVPSTLTKMGGSMYSSSVTTGDFRKFIAEDLVAYVDEHYRTVANRGGRGLAGHSMGGYGIWVIGMTYPQVFDSIWAQSACCVSPRTETVESATRMSQVPIEGVDQSGFGMRAGLASAVAWAPNPNNPPFYVDWPIKDGAIDPSVIERWRANSPLAMVSTHLDALRSFDAIGADVGDKDGLVRDDTLIHEELERHGIAHEWAVYEGTHTDKIGQRFADVVLPFFAEHLDKQ